MDEVLQSVEEIIETPVDDVAVATEVTPEEVASESVVEETGAE